VAREPHDGAVHLLPVANWYRLLVSNAWQADQILLELQSIRVTVGASLRARDKVIGAVATGHQEPKPFSEKQVALLKVFADQAVIAIENPGF
jgi:GAF domain-containing protein